MPTYQVLKSLLKKNPEISFDKEKFIVVSPDEGAMNRNMYFSSVLGCNLGMFYKRRDYTRVVNGRNPIVHMSIWAIPLRARLSLSPTISSLPARACWRLQQPEGARRCPHHCQCDLPAVHQRPEEVRSGSCRWQAGLRCGHQPDLPPARAADPRLVC